MKKKAVLISCFDWYEKRLKPIREILEGKYEVIILTSDFDHIKKEYIKIRNEICIYLHVPSYKKNISLRRLYSHWIFGRTVGKFINKVQPELIYLLLPPNNSAKHCLKYCKTHKETRYIIDLIDLWPESMPLEKYKNNILYHKWAKMRDESLLEADLVFTECNFYQKSLKEKLSRYCKVRTLFLFKEQTEAEKKLVEETIALKLEYKYKKEKELSVCYLGSINHIVDIEGICEILLAMKRAGYKVQMKIIGDGESRDVFIQQLKLVGIQVIFYGMIFDERRKIELLGLCDYGFNMMKGNVSVGLTMKSIDFFSMGIPIINNIKGDTWKLVEEQGIGINYEGDLDKFIINLENSDLVKARQNAGKCYQQYFTKSSFKAEVRAGLSSVGLVESNV